ncbi:MAG: DUF924 family protein [Nannocystaceae bacterium]
MSDTEPDTDRDDIEAILVFWFGELSGPHDIDPSKNSLWWAGGEAVDQEVRERFGERVGQALAQQLEHWTESPRGTLALVILLDQFTRNIGRGTPEAFAGDALAVAVVELALQRGDDQHLRPVERGFLYMPLMHAEDREIGLRCLEVFERLAKDIAALDREGYPDFLSAAKAHQEIVQRFGRYPHRNAILGREPTAEEEQFLASGGPSFGQSKG